jgi:uncharacterized protein
MKFHKKSVKIILHNLSTSKFECRNWQKVNKFGLPQKNIKSLNHIFSQYPLIKEVIIYGSRAKGNFRDGSDIDLTLKGERLNMSDLLRIENQIEELLLPYKIDLSLYHQI